MCIQPCPESTNHSVEAILVLGPFISVLIVIPKDTPFRMIPLIVSNDPYMLRATYQLSSELGETLPFKGYRAV